MENSAKNYECGFMPGEVVVGLKSRNLRARPAELFPELEIKEIEDLYEPLVAMFDSSYEYDPAYEVANRRQCKKICETKRENLNILRKNVKKPKLDRLRKKSRTVYVIKLSSSSKKG